MTIPFTPSVTIWDITAGMQGPEKKCFISFSLTQMNNDANLQINSEDIHIKTVFLNTVQSNVKCKITNKSPFCQHAPDVTNENRPIRFISRQHPIYIPSHIKCHLKPPISHSENYSSGLRNRTGIQCILCPKIYTFANKLLDVEREKEEFFFILFSQYLFCRTPASYDSFLNV